MLPWAELLRRVFSIDVLVCPRCLGAMTVIAYLTDPVVVEKILLHLGLPASPPRLAPPRLPGQVEMFDDAVTEPDRTACRPSPRGRGPPDGQNHPASMGIDEPTDTWDWGAF